MNEVVEVTVKNSLRVPSFDLSPMIFDELVGMKDVAPDLAPETRVENLASLQGDLRFSLLLLELRKATLEYSHRRKFV